MERLITVFGSYLLAHHFLETSGWAESLVSPQESQARNDPAEAVSFRVESTDVTFPGEGATLRGYLSRPQQREDGGPFPGVLLIHENRGLNDHIRDVARRLAAEGFVVLAVDQLSRQGGTGSFPSPDDAGAAFRTLKDEQVVQDLDAAYQYLNSHALAQADHVGVMGFCWGGQRAFLYATANPGLKATVVFYGSPPPEDKLASIESPVLGIYGENDSRVTSTVAATDAAMKHLGKSYEAKVYPGAEHAFFNETGPRYNESAAQDAWTRALGFLKQNLADGS
jgi:carboxymethylenebutenolidase